MIRSAITVSLVPEAAGGPFVYWDGLENACARASALGFDAIEIFPRDVTSIELPALQRCLDEHGLKVAAVGTGAGWIVRKLSLTSPDPQVREDAKAFVSTVIDFAARLDAPAIVGSMQGRCAEGVSRQEAIAWLADGFESLAERARGGGIPLLYEPLNRYETNLFNCVDEAAAFVNSLSTRNLRILADLFHMNIEEVSVPDAIRSGGSLIGHVHFADSNRRAAGMGHTDFAPIANALREIDFSGYLSAEVLPLPDSNAAAEQTIRAFRQHFPRQHHGSGGSIAAAPVKINPVRFPMLKHQLTHPKINEILARAGHHSKILIADGNYPASTKRGPNAELVSLNLSPGVVTVSQVLRAILSAVPIDHVNTMGIPADDPYAQSGEPPVWSEFREIIAESGSNLELAPIQKWDFYQAVASDDHVLTVQTADQSLWANVLLTMGCRTA